MLTNFCYNCKAEKPITDFAFKNKVKETLQSTCKECKKSYNKIWYQKNTELHKQNALKNKQRYSLENLEYILSFLKEHPCVDCGEKDPIVLDFDHLCDKKYNISEMIHSHPPSSLLKEIAKCEIRCSNCHRKKTAKDQSWFKFNNAPVV